MPKINPLALFDVAPKRETREFTDPQQPGEVLTLTLQRLEYPDRVIGTVKAQELIAAWVNPPDGMKPLPWPPPMPGRSQRPIRWSEALCTTLAMLETAQCPADPEDVYDALELAVISVRMPSAWEQVVDWANELDRSESGNASAACEGPSSAPPASGEECIPASFSTSPISAGVSTSNLPDGTVCVASDSRRIS